MAQGEGVDGTGEEPVVRGGDAALRERGLRLRDVRRGLAGVDLLAREVREHPLDRDEARAQRGRVGCARGDAEARRGDALRQEEGAELERPERDAGEVFARARREVFGETGLGDEGRHGRQERPVDRVDVDAVVRLQPAADDGVAVAGHRLERQGRQRAVGLRPLARLGLVAERAERLHADGVVDDVALREAVGRIAEEPAAVQLDVRVLEVVLEARVVAERPHERLEVFGRVLDGGERAAGREPREARQRRRVRVVELVEQRDVGRRARPEKQAVVARRRAHEHGARAGQLADADTFVSPGAGFGNV